MNDLIPVTYGDQRILTTEQLAEVYETDIDNIKQNFKRNKERFAEGKHYHLLKDNDLKAFKRQVTESDQPLISKYVSQIYLWKVTY